MRLKSFYAPTLKEAMQTIRDTLGPEAIIVATRNDPRGGGVHVTAALELGFLAREEGDLAQDGDEDWLQYDREREASCVAEILTDVMLFHAVPETITEEIIACASVSGYAQAEEALAEALSHLFFFGALPQSATPRPIVFIGPPGAGKTTTIVRMATMACIAGLRPAIICADTARAGAAAQLEVLTKILSTPLLRAENPKDLPALIAHAKAQGAHQILIDTPGINPLSTEQMRDLASLVKASGGEVVLILPAGLDPIEAGEQARIFAAVGAKHILPTRLDGTRRFGSLLSAANKGGLTFVAATATPNIAQGFMCLTPRSLAYTLLHGTKAYEDSHNIETKEIA